MGADICIVMNSGSGGEEAAARREAVEGACRRYPGRFEVRRLGKDDDVIAAAKKAVEEGFETVVAAGGDGTVAAVAGCLAGTEARMGVLALGTFNYFARSLGLPEEVEEAIPLIAEGGSRRIDTAEVNGRIFLSNASLGAYPQILDQRERTFRRWGRSRLLAYLVTLATLLRFRSPLRAVLKVDGVERRVRTSLIFVSKNAGQLEEHGLEGADCVRSGRFAVFVAPDTTRFGLVLFAFRLAAGLSERREDFELLCGRDVVVETTVPRRLVARDGERESMTGPFVFKLHTDSLTIVAPANGQADGGAGGEGGAG